MEQTHYLSVIVPVYNEEQNIFPLHRRIKEILGEQQFSYEVIYVDDGSTDGTGTQLQFLVAQEQHVRVIQLRRNFGQTAALAAGVDASSGSILVFMDGDLQNDPVDIPRLLAKLEEGYDVVSGWRRQRKDALISRKIPSWLANRLISQVTGIHLHDYGCTLKAFRREVFEHLHLYGDMHRFLPAYAAIAGASIAEIEVRHHPRRAGASKYGLSRTVRVLLDLLTVKFFSKYAARPLHAFGLAGLAFLLLALLSMGIALAQALRPQPAQQPASMQTCHSGWRGNRILLLLGFGMQALMLGITAEMLTRTYYEAQGKAIYTVKAVYSSHSSPSAQTGADASSALWEPASLD
ncbi:MAG: glycosyltransferase family 2 protein [Ktedonobacteraceae bacterium]|nr:glycosyltransferase family 2 protein [Ktedonobacteraceae bacterium]